MIGCSSRCSLIWRACLLLLMYVPSPSPLLADNWPNWRGPALDGVAADTGYVTSWSPTENVLWRIKLPGLGASTPAVWDDKVIVTCAIDGKDAAICLDRNGKEVWRSMLNTEKAGKHKKATGSNPSPVTDGKNVWVYYKSGELVCLRMNNGVIAWQTNLQERFAKDTLWWDLGISPVLSARAVIVAVMQSGPSYLVAFDRLTGKPLWKHDRMLTAPEEAAQSYSTPVVFKGDPKKKEPKEMLVVLGADHVTAHDAVTGRELWRVGGLNPAGDKFFRSIASPVVAGDIVIAPYARGNTITGIRRGGAGDVTASHVAWTRKDIGSDVPTPATRDGRLIVCTDKGMIACLDAPSGATLWTGELPKNRNTYSSSPVLMEGIDGKIIVTREDGHSTIVAGPATQAGSFSVIGEGSLDEMTVATPVCVDGKIFLRTHDSLWCIGKKE